MVHCNIYLYAINIFVCRTEWIEQLKSKLTKVILITFQYCLPSKGVSFLIKPRMYEIRDRLHLLCSIPNGLQIQRRRARNIIYSLSRDYPKSVEVDVLDFSYCLKLGKHLFIFARLNKLYCFFTFDLIKHRCNLRGLDSNLSCFYRTNLQRKSAIMETHFSLLHFKWYLLKWNAVHI